MRRRILLALLLGVPLLVLPSARSFDTPKAFLLLLGAAALAGAALPRRSGEGPLLLRWSPASAALGAVLVLAAVAALRSPDPWASARAASLLLAAAVVALAVENFVGEAADLRPLLAAVAGAAGVAAGYGLLQAAGVDLPFPWHETHPGVPASTLGNPNFAAEFVAAALPITLLVALRAHRPAGWAAPALGVLFLVVAAPARAAFLGVAVGAGLAGCLSLATRPGRRDRVLGGTLAALLAAGLAAGAALVYRAPERLPAWLGRSDTVLVRAELARSTGRMLADHPLGVGLAGWEAAIPPYRSETEARASLFRDPGEAHNEPLQFAAEGGWPLLGAALLLSWLLARAALRAARDARGRGEALALAASLAILLGDSLASAPFHRPATLLLASFGAGALAFLGGGREIALRAPGRLAHGAILAALAGGVFLHGSALLGEPPLQEAREYLRQGRGPPAREALARALRRDPGSVEALLLDGDVALYAGKPEEARARFEAVLVLRPRDPIARSNLAHALAALGRDTDARAAWETALATAPWHREANTALGGFLLRHAEPEAALARFERALATDPDYAPAAGGRVETLVARGRLEEAIAAASEAVDRALARRPPDPRTAADLAEAGSRAAPLLADMLLVKGRRLLLGSDPPGGASVLRGLAKGRPTEALLEEAARAFAAAGMRAEDGRMRAGARLAAAEEALAARDFARADREASRAAEVTLPEAAAAEVRVRQASILLRAGKREAALGALGEAAARGWRDRAALEGAEEFAPLRDDPTFRRILDRMGTHLNK